MNIYRISVTIIFFFVHFNAFCLNTSLLLNSGDPSIAYLSPIKARELGQDMMRKLISLDMILNDPVVNDYIEKLGKRLVAHSDSPNTKTTFFVVKSPILNAFAGPGGYIGVNTGLIVFMNNESELAAVLAHEVSHVTQHHIERMFQEVDTSRIPALAGALASIALGVINPILGVSALSATTAGYQQNLINFTRANEREADRIGMRTLYKANFNPMSMPRLFEDLEQTSRLYPNDIPALLRSHPLDADRLADSYERAHLYPQKQYLSSLEFFLIQARVRVDRSDDLMGLLDIFENNLTKNEYQKIGNEYGIALTLIELRSYKKAQKKINALLKVTPNPLFIMANAALATQEKSYDRAINLLNNLYRKNPHYFPVAIQYGLTLYAAGKNKQVIEFLRDLSFQHPNYYPLYFYLAKAQAAEGYIQDAYLSRARMYKALGNLKAAKQQLLVGLKQSGKNPYGKIQIEAMLKSLSTRA